MPSLKSLRAFESVGRLGSFRAAADELHVTPGALSQQVRKLEERIGMPLMWRRNQGLELTPAGTQLLAGLSKGFEHLAAALDDLADANAADTVTLSCCPYFARVWVIPRLPVLLASHPQLNLVLDTQGEMQLSRVRQFDLLVQCSVSAPGDLSSELLTEEAYLPMAAPDVHAALGEEPTTERLLASRRLIETAPRGVSQRPGWREWLRHMGLAENMAQPFLRFSGQLDEGLQAAMAGLGWVLGDPVLASAALDRKQLVPLQEPVLRTGAAYRIMHERSPLTQSAMWVKGWLNEAFKNEKAGYRY